eukprot:2731537-Rhodomonas_salina.2
MLPNSVPRLQGAFRGTGEVEQQTQPKAATPSAVCLPLLSSSRNRGLSTREHLYQARTLITRTRVDNEYCARQSGCRIILNLVQKFR